MYEQISKTVVVSPSEVERGQAMRAAACAVLLGISRVNMIVEGVVELDMDGGDTPGYGILCQVLVLRILVTPAHDLARPFVTMSSNVSDRSPRT